MTNTETTGDMSPPSSPPRGDEFRFEVAGLPVSDVDRAKDFYVTKLGWRLDADFDGPNDFRVVQVTPPGSPASIHFGHGITAAEPGSADHMYLVVSDVEAARAALVARGVDVTEVVHFLPGEEPTPGVDPEHGTYQSFAFFNDPDDNRWILQEITTRLPGR